MGAGDMSTIKIVNIYLFFLFTFFFTNAMFDFLCLPNFRTDTSIVPLKSTTTCNKTYITKSTNITKLSKFKCCMRLLFQIISGQLMPERGLMLDPRAGVMLSTCIVCNEACRACDWDGAKVSPSGGLSKHSVWCQRPSFFEPIWGIYSDSFLGY